MNKKKRALLVGPCFHQKGFSLLEILVALTLVAILFYAISPSDNSGRTSLENTLVNLDQALRFATNEAILRGTMVRLHLQLDKNPIEYSLEASSSADFVLPPAALQSDQNLSLGDKEKRDKKIKKLDQNFQKIAEFQEESVKLPENLRFIGMATGLREGFIADGVASLYIYPSGERDSALLLLASSKEVASLVVEPFSQETLIEYHTLPPQSLESEESIANAQDSLAKEIYENWKKP